MAHSAVASAARLERSPMEKPRLVKGLGAAWILLVLSIVTANAYRNIQVSKTTGMGAVSGPNSLTVFVIAFLVVSGVVLLVMHSRIRYR